MREKNNNIHNPLTLKIELPFTLSPIRRAVSSLNRYKNNNAIYVEVKQ